MCPVNVINIQPDDQNKPQKLRNSIANVIMNKSLLSKQKESQRIIKKTEINSGLKVIQPTNASNELTLFDHVNQPYANFNKYSSRSRDQVV